MARLVHCRSEETGRLGFVRSVQRARARRRLTTSFAASWSKLIGAGLQVGGAAAGALLWVGGTLVVSVDSFGRPIDSRSERAIKQGNRSCCQDYKSSSMNYL